MKKLIVSPKDDLQNILDKLDEPATIYLKSGIYYGKYRVTSDDLTIIGENRETTVITYDDFARKIHADGREYNTFRTYTLCVTGERVKLLNLTVENSNTRPEEVGQCVALSVNAARFCAENVKLVSTQDTLFCAPFPDDLVVRYRGFIPHEELYMEGTSLHCFKNCKICGTVDFIFGGAEAYFVNCEIVSLHDARGKGYIAAPCHALTQEGGFYFICCDIKSEGAEAASVYLARPWRDFGKSVFANCKIGSHVAPALFDKWNDTCRDKTARFSFGGLECGFGLSPVDWADRLSERDIEGIIARYETKIK